MMSTTKRVTGAQALARIYDQLLRPNFPPHELASVDSLVELVRTGRGYVLAMPHGSAYGGVAVVEFQTADLDLLSYLAVGVAGRSRGWGSALLAGVREQTAQRGRPFLLAEIETPDTPEQHSDFGEVNRRAAFYERAGAKAVPITHWQPAVGVGFPPVRLTLIAVPSGDDELTHMPTAPLRAFEVAYHGGSDTKELTDALSSLPSSDTVELISLSDLYQFC